VPVFAGKIFLAGSCGTGSERVAMGIAGTDFPFSFGFAPRGAQGEFVGSRQNEAILVAAFRKIAIDKKLFQENRAARPRAAMAQKLLGFLREIHTKCGAVVGNSRARRTSDFRSARQLKEQTFPVDLNKWIL